MRIEELKKRLKEFKNKGAIKDNCLIQTSTPLPLIKVLDLIRINLELVRSLFANIFVDGAKLIKGGASIK